MKTSALRKMTERQLEILADELESCGYTDTNQPALPSWLLIVERAEKKWAQEKATSESTAS